MSLSKSSTQTNSTKHDALDKRLPCSRTNETSFSIQILGKLCLSVLVALVRNSGVPASDYDGFGWGLPAVRHTWLSSSGFYRSQQGKRQFTAVDIIYARYVGKTISVFY
jgi:hypothetical protein